MKKIIYILLSLVSLSVFACPETEICKNDRVIFGKETGTVYEVFNNGIARIITDTMIFGYPPKHKIVLKPIDKLSKAVECYKGLCSGYRVVFGDYTGTALEVFNNGIVKISVDSYYYRTTLKSVSQLGYAVEE